MSAAARSGVLGVSAGGRRGTRHTMWLGVVLAPLVVAYLAYRFSFVVRSIKARRAGDAGRSDELSTKGRQAFLGMTGAMTLTLLVGVVVMVARR